MIEEERENYEYRLTNHMEVFKLLKLSSKIDRDNIDKEHGKRDQIDTVDDKKYDENDQIGEIQQNEINLEESETDERDHI